MAAEEQLTERFLENRRSGSIFSLKFFFHAYILVRVVEGGSREGKFGSWNQSRISGDRQWWVGW